MSENPKARAHITVIMLPVDLLFAKAGLVSKLKIGDHAALLLALTEGFKQLGALDEEAYQLLASRYRRPLKDIITANRLRREPSHVPVVALEKQKAKKSIDYKKLSDEELQKRYAGSVDSDDAISTMMLKAEADRRGLKVKGHNAIQYRNRGV